MVDRINANDRLNLLRSCLESLLRVMCLGCLVDRIACCVQDNLPYCVLLFCKPLKVFFN